MSIHRFFPILLACGLGFTVLAAEESSSAPKPNFVLIYIDDMGWGDFSCFGNTNVQTAQIDRLAAEGLRFSQFYVNSPICSPSRTAVTTGQYPQRWKINSYLDNRAANQRRGMAQWLDPQAPTLARFLQRAGYRTGHFGKWHMGGQRDVAEAPLITEYGFDETLTQFEGLGPRLLPLCDAHDGNPPRKHALGSDNLGRGPVIWMDREKITGAFASSAVEFMRRSVAEGKPFYVNIWPDDVHSPFFPPAGRMGDRTKRALYHGVLKTMDEQLGIVFDYIRSSPRTATNTLVLVCSDNGPEPGAGSAGPFRGTKATLYEGGIRSPLVVWGPGLLSAGKSGTRNTQSVFSAIDLVPSLLEIAGIKYSQELFDGRTVASSLLGGSEASREAPLFWRRPPDRPGEKGTNLPDLAMREGNWKLVCEFDGSLPQLFDLAQDPGESVNLAEAQSDRVDRMVNAVRTWYQSAP